MNKLLSLMALGLALSAGGAFAASHVGAPMAGGDAKTAQQSKMATCNKDATGKKGDERKAFMKDCLSADAKPTQQTKMKTCNVDAKGMKGDERKKFMSACLKK
ncbi:MAG: psiF [Ramlibacter sp.]|nr:psiF [Ramlibacter sp.]